MNENGGVLVLPDALDNFKENDKDATIEDTTNQKLVYTIPSVAHRNFYEKKMAENKKKKAA